MSTKMTIERTDKWVTVDGHRFRLWEGTTYDGYPVRVLVAGLGIAKSLPEEVQRRLRDPEGEDRTGFSDRVDPKDKSESN